MNPFHKISDTPTSNFDLKPNFEAVERMWKGKKEEEEGFLKTLQDLWKKEEDNEGFEILVMKKNNKEKSWIQKVKKMDFGPGGAVGVGCGVGVGAGLIGGIGFADNPWNHLRFVLGIGAGCGIGIGYGYGRGFGYFWDRRPPQKPKSNRKIIQI